jgi:putative FmdB family regulatory protein
LPLYEYHCASCGQSVDKRHGFDEAMTDRCEHCGGELKRTFNIAGIAFKGSGFYVNDSRKSSGASASKTESKSDAKSEPAASSDAKAETKTETKSEPKTETKKSDTAA